VDSFAAPFVQGRLKKKKLSVIVNSSCAHCSEPMEMEITSEFETTVHGEDGRSPIIFIPDVNVRTLKEPSIIESF